MFEQYIPKATQRLQFLRSDGRPSIVLNGASDFGFREARKRERAIVASRTPALLDQKNVAGSAWSESLRFAMHAVGSPTRL